MQPWPITGGQNLASDPPQRDLLLTGSVQLNFEYIHWDISLTDSKSLLEYNFSLCVCVCRHEDGTVCFWDASGVCLYPMYKLSTAGVFHTDTDPNDNMNQGTEGEWPPFRKVVTHNLLLIHLEKLLIDPSSIVEPLTEL